MKVWFLADSHFGAKSGDDDVLNEYCKYYNDVLIPYMRMNVSSDDILVHLGDVFDNRSIIGIKTIYSVVKLFEGFSEIFNDIRVCVGNHDMYNLNSTEITALHAIKHIKGVKMYFKPEVETISGKSVLFMPWIEDLKGQRNVIKNSNVDYVFGHLQISGCISNGKGTKLAGDDMAQTADFKKAQVYAGHIHIRQDFKNVHYVGSPYHKDRGDIGNKKGITILDMETGKTEFIENTYSPIYLTENIYDILDETVGDVKKRWSNNYVDISVNRSDYVDGVLEKLKKCLDNCYKTFEPKIINNDDVIEVNENWNSSEMKSSSELLSSYIDSCDIDDEQKGLIDTFISDFMYKI